MTTARLTTVHDEKQCRGVRGLRKISLRQKKLKQTLSYLYHALYVSYVSKRFFCYNVFHLFEIVGNLTKTTYRRLKSSLEKYIFEKYKILKKILKSNSKFVSSLFQANKTIKKVRPT